MAEATRIALFEVVFHHSKLMAGERERAECTERMLNEELDRYVK